MQLTQNVDALGTRDSGRELVGSSLGNEVIGLRF